MRTHCSCKMRSGLWKSSCGAGKALHHEKSTRCFVVRGVFGNGIILIGWFGMKDISRIAYDISAGILQRRACTVEITLCTKLNSHEASSKQEAHFSRRRTRDRRSLIHSNSASNSSSRRSNKCSVLSMGAGVVISTPAAFNVSSGNLEPPERKNFR